MEDEITLLENVLKDLGIEDFDEGKTIIVKLLEIEGRKMRLELEEKRRLKAEKRIVELEKQAETSGKDINDINEN